MYRFQQIFLSSIVFFGCFAQASLVIAVDNKKSEADHDAGCASILPADAHLVENFHLCRVNHHGKNETYACRDFTSGKDRYRVYFKGGRFARAVGRFSSQGKLRSLRWFRQTAGPAPVQQACDARPPDPVPSTAQFKGAGVCEDESGKNVACSVFRNRAPRLSFITDYIVLYTGPGGSHLKIWSKHISINHDAMLAELEYQIGLSLLDTSCCQAQGMKYLEHAIHLYPGATVYMDTYRKMLKQLAGYSVGRLTLYANKKD